MAELADGHNGLWYQWTPLNAGSAAYEDIAAAIEEFESLETPAGDAATVWLKQHALANHPSSITYLLLLDGRLEGYFAMVSSSLELTQRRRKTLRPGEKDYPLDPTQGASLVAWIARNRHGTLPGRHLVTYAISIALEVAAHQGTVALVLDPYDEATGNEWAKKYGFKSARTPDGLRPRLWLPLHPAE